MGLGLRAHLFTCQKIDHQNGAVPDKSKGKRRKRWRKQGGAHARAVGVREQARDAMRVARRAGGAHLDIGSHPLTRGALRRREPSERWSRRRPAAAIRTPTPAEHQADRGAQAGG